MGVTFADTTIISDTIGNVMNGEHKFVRGDIEDQVIEWTIPGTNGTGEKTLGDKKRTHIINARFFTTDENTVASSLEAFRTAKTIGTLVVSGVQSKTFTKCRLADIKYGQMDTGRNSQGTLVAMLPAVLTFKQVRV